MAKKKKSKRGKAVASGGIIGLIIFFLLNGNFSLDLLGDGNEIDTSPSEVNEVINQEIEDESEDKEIEIVVEVIDNTIFVNDKEVTLDTLISEIGDNSQVVYRTDNAKQVTYDEVKSLLKSNDIIIIEE